MQVREPGKSAPLGNWIPSSVSQTFHCSGDDNTLIQKNAQNSSSVEETWVAPTDVPNEVIVV